MDIEPINDNSLQFNTCKFRSVEQIDRLIKRCSCKGGDYTVQGYFCERRQIFQVSSEICSACPVYEPK